MSTKRILVATDGSAGANRAIDAAAGLAKALDADLMIATFGGSFSHEELEELSRTEGKVGEAIDLSLNSILRQAKERAEPWLGIQVNALLGWFCVDGEA